MNKRVKTAAASMMEKIAEEKEEVERRTYPISRALTGTQDVLTLGLTKHLQQRARQGRANIGEKPATKAEEIAMKNIKKDGEDVKTYPISRILTNPILGASTGAVSGAAALGAKSRNPYSAAIGALLGGTSGYFGTIHGRDLYSRADIGRANIGRKGIGDQKQRQLKKLRQTKRDNTKKKQKEMDRDTAINAAGAYLPKLITG